MFPFGKMVEGTKEMSSDYMFLCSMFRIYMTTQPPELQPLSFASVQGLVSSWVV